MQWAAAAMRADGLENVRLEPVEVPHWVRGEESLTMTAPRRADIPMLGLGGSVGTGPDGITAEVVVVRDEEEFEALGAGAHGKIVLFNNPMPPYDPERGAGYGRTVRFRGKGAFGQDLHATLGYQFAKAVDNTATLQRSHPRSVALVSMSHSKEELQAVPLAWDRLLVVDGPRLTTSSYSQVGCKRRDFDSVMCRFPVGGSSDRARHYV